MAHSQCRYAADFFDPVSVVSENGSSLVSRIAVLDSIATLASAQAVSDLFTKQRSTQTKPGRAVILFARPWTSMALLPDCATVTGPRCGSLRLGIQGWTLCVNQNCLTVDEQLCGI
jgi:hypothetical protein